MASVQASIRSIIKNSTGLRSCEGRLRKFILPVKYRLRFKFNLCYNNILLSPRQRSNFSVQFDLFVILVSQSVAYRITQLKEYNFNSLFDIQLTNYVTQRCVIYAVTERERENKKEVCQKLTLILPSSRQPFSP